MICEDNLLTGPTIARSRCVLHFRYQMMHFSAAEEKNFNSALTQTQPSQDMGVGGGGQQ